MLDDLLFSYITNPESLSYNKVYKMTRDIDKAVFFCKRTSETTLRLYLTKSCKLGLDHYICNLSTGWEYTEC